MHKSFYPPLNSVNPVIIKESAELASQPIKENKLKTLKSRAIPTALTPFSEADSAALARLLSENTSSNFTIQTFRGRQVFAALFVNQTARGRFQVQVPENGDFNLRISEGPRFDIVDANATDGEAHIVMPAATFETVFHLQRNRRANTVLKVKDSLYNVQDELTSNKYKWIDLNRFLGLGKRPVPVPASWQSDNGADLVLNFEAQNLEGFQMLWYETDEPADFPPGIAEIGSAGGVVELPGVGRLEVPAGALTSSTTLIMKEQLEVPEYMEYALQDASARTFVSSVVKLHPDNLTLQQAARLSLTLDDEKIGNNDPIVTQWSRLEALESGETAWALYIPELLPEPLSRQDDDTVAIKSSGSYAKTMPGFIQPNDGYAPWSPSSSPEGFQTQQLHDLCGSSQDNPIVLIAPESIVPLPPNSPTNEDYSSLSCFALDTYNYYKSLIVQAGGKIPVAHHVHDPGYSGQINLQIPVYLGLKDETPVTRSNLAAADMILPYIKMPFSGGATVEAKETFAHELWHVFQYASLLNYAQLSALAANNYWLWGGWVIEGPAVHMGGKAIRRSGLGEPPNYRTHLATNQREMNVSLPNRKSEVGTNGYSTGGFFTHLVNSNGEIALARLATKTGAALRIGSIDSVLQGSTVKDLYKEFGYAAEEGSSFLTASPPKPEPKKPYEVMSLQHTRENPRKVDLTLAYLASESINVTLDPELKEKNQSFKLFVKQGESNPDLKVYAVPYSVPFTGSMALRQIKGKVEVENGYIEISDFGKEGTVDGVIVIVSNGNYNGSVKSQIQLALESEDKSRVQVQTSSPYSMGGMDPVTVSFDILDEAGEPANGNYYIGADEGYAGTFVFLEPASNAGARYDARGAFVNVVDGKATLIYSARATTRDSGINLCDGSPCKRISVHFKVSGCDFAYYGKDRCPILGPDKEVLANGEESDKGRIYTTWLDSWEGPQELNLKMDGQTHGVNYTGLTDSAGRVVPDGYTLYVNGPYYGQISRLDGSSSGVWVPMAVKSGGLQFLYQAPYAPRKCWPILDTQDKVTFDDTRYAASWSATALVAKYAKAPEDCIE